VRHTRPTSKQSRLWLTWAAERPPLIREAIEKHKLDPWTLYRLKTTGQRVYLLSISEPSPTADQKVTVRVGVSGEFNLVTFERDVFGVDPAELEECDLPGPTEQIGSLDLPVDVIKNLRDRYADEVPRPVMLDLITRYPLKQKRNGVTIATSELPTATAKLNKKANTQ
jgi:hypothetical protein